MIDTMTDRRLSRVLTGPVCLPGGCRLWLSVLCDGQEQFFGGDDSDPVELESLHSVDQQRWRRYRGADKRQQFLHSRLVLVDVLRLESERRGTSLAVDATAGKRPACVDRSGREVASISLSHSGPVVAIAVADLPNRVGVDVELVRPFRALAVRSLLELAADTLHDACPLPHPNDTSSVGEEQIRTAWVVQEAAWKAGSCDDFADAGGARRRNHDGPDMVASPWSDARHGGSAADLQIELFVAGCEPLIEGTRSLAAGGLGSIAVRGCVALRTSRQIHEL